MYKDRACAVETHDTGPTLIFASVGIRHHFMAWLPQGIVGPKMHGFINEQNAQVLNADDDHIRLQIGQKRWLPWARYGEDCPIELYISINRETTCARSLTHVVAQVTPLATVPPETLHERYQEVIKALRYCLLAQELELA
jgi:hypothetical protein